MSTVLTGGTQTTERGKTNFEKFQDSFNKFIVKPANLFGLGGFAFDIDRETSISLSADITDHFVEDNVAVQDHIAVRPLRLSLRNFVGEVVFEGNKEKETARQIQEVVRKLTILSAFLPEVTTGAQQAQDLVTQKEASDFTAITESVLDLWTLTKNLNPGASRQQQAYLYFESLLQQKILVSVQTPYKFLKNMAIESISATQNPDSQFISDFSITLKAIRTTSFEVVPFDPDKFSSRTSQQSEPVENKGKAQGKQKDSSTLFEAINLY